MVLDKIRTDGLLPTVEAVFSKLDQPVPLGYCNVGTVVQCGPGVAGFAPGDRVVSNGRHAEIVSAPVNLCAPVPASVPDDAAAFTVLGAIALQGIRLARPTLGETIVVTGLGLIGLITVQLLRANGCRVLGIDFDARKLALAKAYGAEVIDLAAGVDAVAAATSFSRGRGVDAVLITASTSSSEPVHQAALMSRKRGRIVLVGVSGLELNRADFYEKELTFQVSCSYGPGRHDPNYEEKGQDYPLGYVRWTEQRNFEAVLDMMAAGSVDVRDLVSHRFELSRAADAYALLTGSEPSLGILLEYDAAPARLEQTLRRTTEIAADLDGSKRIDPAIACIGSGNFATAILFPALKRAGANLLTVACTGGVSGVHAARKFGFKETTTASDAALQDPRVGAVVITTRHDSHAGLVKDALRAGKHVFVEKPLCLTDDELTAIREIHSISGKLLMVGFNRRFAPHVRKVKLLLDAVPGPKSFVMTVNAGVIPAGHWTQNPAVGGGRVLGEACHFVDLLRFLADSPIESSACVRMDAPTADTVSISLRFADGSIGTIHYFANGSRSFPKERLEVFATGRVLQLDNFRRLTAFGWPGFHSLRLWRQDKGHNACAAAFLEAIRGSGPPPIPPEEIFEVSRWAICVARPQDRTES